MDKKTARQILLAKDIVADSSRIIAKIRMNPYYQKAKIVGIYQPIAHEVNILPLTSDDRIFCYPRVISKKEMIFARDNGRFEKSRFGIWEPCGAEVIPDLLLCPMLGYRADGYRLGYGGGYYDRYLARHDCVAIGVCFSAYEADFETDWYDRKMTLIITEK